jgi:NitT/TauT family transport system substrate-binding protein
MALRIRAIASCLLFSAALLAACGGAAAPTPLASGAPPASGSAAPAASVAGKPGGSAVAGLKPSGSTKLTVGLSQIIAQFLPAWVAKDSGVYARHGLEVDQRTATATATMASLLSGELSVAVTGGPETLNAFANGADLVIVGNLAPVAALKFIVPASVKSKEDLVGKSVGITRLGSTTHSNSRALFSQIGLNPDKDVAYVQLDNSPAEAAALISGNIQGALLAPPESTKLEHQGYRVLYDLGVLKFPATGQLLVIPRAWLNAHHDTAQQWVDSLVDARALLQRDKPAALASLKTGMKLDDPESLNGVYDYFVSSILAPVPYIQPEHLANDIAVITQQTGKLKDLDLTKILDNSLVKSAADRGLAQG